MNGIQDVYFCNLSTINNNLLQTEIEVSHSLFLYE